MIDRVSRDKLAELLHQFVAGRITNDEFQDRSPRSGDPAVREVVKEAWLLYDDLREHRLTGKWKLTPQTRTDVAQWIMFLKTDQPYEWPVFPGWLELAFMAVNLSLLGLLGFFTHRWFANKGEIEVWPFIRRKDFESAKAVPKYLSGVA